MHYYDGLKIWANYFVLEDFNMHHWCQTYARYTLLSSPAITPPSPFLFPTPFHFLHAPPHSSLAKAYLNLDWYLDASHDLGITQWPSEVCGEWNLLPRVPRGKATHTDSYGYSLLMKLYRIRSANDVVTLASVLTVNRGFYHEYPYLIRL